MAAKIQQRNEVANRQCVDLQKRFSADGGFESAILKGQDYARYYYFNHNLDDNHNHNDNLNDDVTEGSNHKSGSGLRLLRQSGDIDLWVNGDMDKVIAYARSKGVEVGHIDIKHSDMRFFADTEVEAHFRPSWMYCPRTDKKL